MAGLRNLMVQYPFSHPLFLCLFILGQIFRQILEAPVFIQCCRPCPPILPELFHIWFRVNIRQGVEHQVDMPVICCCVFNIVDPEQPISPLPVVIPDLTDDLAEFLLAFLHTGWPEFFFIGQGEIPVILLKIFPQHLPCPFCLVVLVYPLHLIRGRFLLPATFLTRRPIFPVMMFFHLYDVCINVSLPLCCHLLVLSLISLSS